MKVLVIGSLAPPDTDQSESLLAEVVDQRAAGHEVEILSPTPYSVAHRYLELSGPAASLEIVLAVRRADRVIFQFAPEFPLSLDATRGQRAVALGALAAALGRTRGEIVLRLHSIHDLPQGLGGRAAQRLWSLATRIVVDDEITREALAQQLGADGARKVELSAPARARAGEAVSPGGSFAAEGTGSSDPGAPADLATVTRLVRGRAAAERIKILCPDLSGGQSDRSPRVPLWQWAPSPGAGVPSWADASVMAPPAGSVARRAARSLLHGADRFELTRPIARGVRLARKAAARI